jgi:hemerythrin-like domain-containing protein
METKLQPLKRHPELVNLSREHRFELLFAWKIKQGLVRTADSRIIRDYVRYFWDKQLESHLEKEEKIVVQVLSEADPMRFRLQQDHDLIRSLVNCLSSERQHIDYLLDALQHLVREHVRFEERVFFPYLENIATPGQLILMGLEIEKHSVPLTDDFVPAFWLTGKKNNLSKEDE